MVDVTTALPSNGGGSIMGRTKGALKSMRSALGGGGEYLQDLGNRIGTALSNSLEESDLRTPSTPASSPLHPSSCELDQENDLASRRKLRPPRYNFFLFFFVLSSLNSLDFLFPRFP